MYQNVQVGGATEQQYQNVQVGAGEVGQVFDAASPITPQQQPNYCNVSMSSAGNSSSSVPGPMEGAGHVIKVNGDAMGTYAQLELSSDSGYRSKRTMSSSTPRDSSSQQYPQLDFPLAGRGEESSPAQEAVHRAGHGRRSASLSSSLPTTSSGVGSKPLSLAQQNIPEEDPTHPKVQDPTRVTYGVLNFAQMDARDQLHREREQQKEQEREERERANTHKGKKKDK